MRGALLELMAGYGLPTLGFGPSHMREIQRMSATPRFVQRAAPTNGKREVARRFRQIQAGQLKVSA